MRRLTIHVCFPTWRPRANPYRSNSSTVALNRNRPPALEPHLGREARIRARWSQDDDYVFSARRGKPREYRNLRRALAHAAQNAGLPGVRAHDFRHSFTSTALQHGDLATVSRYVGHANVGVTARVYAHAIGSPAEQAARVAAAMRAAGLGY